MDHGYILALAFLCLAP